VSNALSISVIDRDGTCCYFGGVRVHACNTVHTVVEHAYQQANVCMQCQCVA